MKNRNVMKLLTCLILIGLLIPVPVVLSQEVPEELQEQPVELETSNRFPDSVIQAETDTVHIVRADSLDRSELAHPSLFKRLIQPVALTAAIGGVLFLLFTQRGR